MSEHSHRARIDCGELQRAAAGRWQEILIGLGIPAKALTKKNKPCPACGGRDRFSFIDQGRGAFICRAMNRQGGDGLALLQHAYGWDFAQTLQEVAAYLGMDGTDNHRPRYHSPSLPVGATPQPVNEKQAGAIRQTWEGAHSIGEASPAALYLRSRGLAVPDSAALRSLRLLAYWHKFGDEDRPRNLGQFPALIAAITAADGTFAGIHQTFVTHNGAKLCPLDADGLPLLDNGKPLPCKKLKTIREGVMRGAAVRLFSPEEGRLAVAEGIETALAVRVLSGLPVWACVSAFGLETFAIPPEVKELFIFGDCDQSDTGQRAAQRLARRAMAEGVAVRVLIPAQFGDWLDVLNQEQGGQR